MLGAMVSAPEPPSAMTGHAIFEHQRRRHAGDGARAGARSVRALGHAEDGDGVGRGEVGELVVEEDAALLGDELGAEGVVDGRGQADPIAVGVGGDEVMRAGVLQAEARLGVRAIVGDQRLSAARAARATSSLATSTVTNAGSPTKRARSAAAPRIASASRCMRLLGASFMANSSAG